MTDVKKDSPVSEENVNVDETTKETEEVTPEDVTSEVTETLKAGDKTDPNLLLKSLQEERDKRKKLEDDIEQLKSSALTEEPEGEEEEVVSGEVKELSARLSKIEEEKVFNETIVANPELKEVQKEFQTFLNENANLKHAQAATLFIAEKGLKETVRQGLEKTTGGDRTPQTAGMTIEEVKDLRENNYKQYRELVKAGKLIIKK